MRKKFYFAYGLATYTIALVGQVAFILYLTQWEMMPRNIFMSQTFSTSMTLLINISLVVLWGLQHSVMARGWFKEKFTAFIPPVLERSTYVLFSGIVLILFVLYWQPLDGTLWDVKNETLRVLLWSGFVFGWLFSVVATFVINHFELFGLQQVYLHLLNKPTPTQAFTQKKFYKFIRHPIQFGVLLGLRITPVMSMGHLLLSALMSMYIFIGLYFEEKDLVEEIGEEYVAYKQRVGMMFPKKEKRG